MFEKVNPAHPDKIADRIAGALVDLAYTQEKNPKIAVEVLIGHGICHIVTETSTHLALEDVQEIVCRIAGDGIAVDYQEAEQDPILEPDGYVTIGDIVLSLERAKEQAAEIGNSFKREVAFLVIHSTLHLLGYDHERSKEDEEAQCLAQREIIETIEI